MFRFLRTFERARRLLAHHWRRAVLGLLCVPVHALCGLALPGITRRIIDGAETGDAVALGHGILLFLGIALLGVAAHFVARLHLIGTSRLVEERLKSDLMAHISRLPVNWFDRARTGDLISRLTQDIELVRFVLGPFPLYTVGLLITVPGGLILMWQVSPRVMLAATGALALLAIALALVMPRLEQLSDKVQAAIAEISARAAEDFAGIRVLLPFGRTRQQARTFARLCEDYLQHNLRLVRFKALMNLCIGSAGDLVILSLLVIGGLDALQGRMTIGQFFEFNGLLSLMIWPLIAAGWMLALLPQAAAGAKRIEEMFTVAPEAQTGTTPVLRGAITVRNLTFSHRDQPVPALADVSFALAAGHKLGIVGPVGSGKSTLLAMLLRLHEPPRGTVFVDGHDVLDLAPHALRSAFAVAPQDPFLFSDTIRGNVAFGRHDADEATIEAAVRDAALERDLPDLQEGLESIVGERGITLSGGQKQRVSLARAFASGRGALVLDDTLSAVDHSTEAAILESLRARRGERTLIVTAHRLSAVADADLILYLRQGRVVEQGTHEELLRRNGEYAAAWHRQQEADALEGDVEA